MTERVEYLPDLVLVGLSIDDLYDLQSWLKPLHATFNTETLGAPFIARYHGAGVYDDTQIGQVVSSIDQWALKQQRRVIQALELCIPTSGDEADMRAAMLMADVLTMGDWRDADATFKRLKAQAEALGRSK